jgi:hypothetical protein
MDFCGKDGLCRNEGQGTCSGSQDGLFTNKKAQIWVNFGGPLDGKCWCIL